MHGLTSKRSPNGIIAFFPFSDVNTQFPTMDNLCHVNNVVIRKRNRTEDKSIRTISYLSVDHQII